MEVIQVVQRIRDVVREIHHRALQCLAPRREPGKCGKHIEQLWHVDDVGGELRGSRAARVPGTSRWGGPVHWMWIWIAKAGPGILQHRRASRCREVQPLVSWP